MSLASRTSICFSNHAKRKGESYFRRDMVEPGLASASGVSAQVQGSSSLPYDVNLDWSQGHRGVLRATCSCPNFADGDLCKHIWATILEVDAHDMEPGGSNRLQVEWIDPELDDDGFDDDLDWESEDDLALAPGRSSATSQMLDHLASTFQVDPERLRGPLESIFGQNRATTTGHRRPAPAPPPWKSQLEKLRQAVVSTGGTRSDRSTAPQKQRETYFRLNTEASRRTGRLTIDFRVRDQRKNGGWGKMKDLPISEGDIASFNDPVDRALLDLLYGGARALSYQYGYHSYYREYEPKATLSEVRPSMYDLILPRLCATGRFHYEMGQRNPTTHPLAWDGGDPWRFELAVNQTGEQLTMSGHLCRGEETIPLADTVLLIAEGLIVFRDRIARLDTAGADRWPEQLRVVGPITIPKRDRDQFVERLWQMPDVPPVQLPASLKLEQVRLPPQPHITFFAPKHSTDRDPLAGKLSFDYDKHRVTPADLQAGIVDRPAGKVYLRDRAAEEAAWEQLYSAGANRPTAYQRHTAHVSLPRKDLPRAVAKLAAAGWLVEAEGFRVRQAGRFDLSVSSGVDWFELASEVDFDGIKASLPELLAAVRRGEQFVMLSDGSQGMLPEEWLKRYAPLAEMGETAGDKLRFRPTQAALLDALLAAQDSVRVDEGFERWRDRLRGFAGVKPGDQPAGFVGQLRDYQREGLGWLGFLQEFEFGGCLADDMGLGKTIQVLAMLEQRRAAAAASPANGNGNRSEKMNAPAANVPTSNGQAAGDASPGSPPANGQPHAPSLVVAPRSLIHNWIEEAARFAPQLRVLDYTGLGRGESRSRFAETDLIVTTYGTLRRDIAELKDQTFDYCILDEAQAIKNATSQAAKACRLVSARHRLAMTGTPVENHLGELWSLFEFLNPGMLGRSSAMKLLTRGKGEPDEPGGVQVLAQALRPYLLRRTKEQVLRELPEKTEQTLYCELEPGQQKLYNELRDHFRLQLAAKIKDKGLEKSKIHVLEALLRLRQAACHPGLLDKKKIDHPSAKLETLLEQVAEVMQGGHKALVFSQFTSLLAIVRKRLDAEGVTYEYLDGQTRDRKQRVDRFQNDADCRLFLISLKAGGLGLNLTAADYVFILDPWWNPAVESQAVDRAHRIGQTRPVFAYRLIARDTVEEKILQLQGDKRRLAEAIVSADNSLISSLTAEDLTLLLS